MKTLLCLTLLCSTAYGMQNEGSPEQRFFYPIMIAGIKVKTRERSVRIDAHDTSITLNGNQFDIRNLQPGTYIYEGTSLIRDEFQDGDNT